MHSEGKVLTGLLERRKLEAALEALAQIEDLDQLVAHAAQIASNGAKVLPALLGMLDTEDPQMRGGLGHVAARLDRGQVVPALLEVARSPRSSDHARLSALTILDRFLGEPVDEHLLARLHDPEQVARQSLRELSYAMQRDHFAIIEYLEQLAEQPPEVSQIILDATLQVPADSHLITLLRMLAQDDNPTVARAALDRLGRIRMPESVLALNALAATLPPTEAALAARGVRKLRMSGVLVPVQQGSMGQWRALLSPVDGTGAQLVWFASQSSDEDVGTFLTLVLQDPTGIIAAFRTTEKTAEMPLPFKAATGSLHVIPLAEDAPSVMLLTVPIAEARRTVRAALHRNWESGYPTPLLFRLLSPELLGCGQADVARAGDETSGTPPDAGGREDSDVASDRLLDHPLFAGWTWSLAEQIDRLMGSNREWLATDRASTISAIASELFEAETAASYERRLAAMSRWLDHAADQETAELAHAAARQLAACRPSEVPFVRRLIEDALDLVQSRSEGLAEQASEL